jgi:pyruvate dehydrogenase E1 component beta subunit
MPTEILMPALSPTMEEGKLAKWLVEEGQTIKAGDVIAEIETDKATMEVEASDEGKVSKLLIPAGTEGVKVNTPIAVLDGDGGAPAKAKATATAVAAPRKGGGDRRARRRPLRRSQPLQPCGRQRRPLPALRSPRMKGSDPLRKARVIEAKRRRQGV